MLFEQIHVPALYISPSSPLSLYATGRTTGLVLDSGEGVTHATPIYEGFVVPHATLRSEFGGRDVTEWLSLLMRKAGTTLNCAAELETVKDVKESTCFISQHPNLDEASVTEGRFSPAEYRLPDGQRISVGAERFRAPEILFRPSLAGLECRGVGDLVASSIQRTDLDLRTSLYSSVVLTGGSTLTRGFGARLLSEMRKLSPDVKLRIWAPTDRQILTWVGGSILASLGTFKSLWITKEQYEEEGSRCLHSGF
jgi:centractin